MSNENAIVQLYQDGGCTGPRETIPTTAATAVRDAIAWAESQAGHPWDGIIVTVYSDENQRDLIDTHQVAHRDGAWECV